MLVLFSAIVLLLVKGYNAANYIFCAAFTYSPRVVAPFLLSARDAGIDAEIFVAVNPSQVSSMQPIADKYNVRFIPMHDEIKQPSPYVSRFKIYHLWTHYVRPDDNILTAGDALFVGSLMVLIDSNIV